MINTTTRQFESDLARVVNNAALPACIIRLVLEKVTSQVAAIEQDCIAREQSQEAQTEEAQSEEEKETEKG